MVDKLIRIFIRHRKGDRKTESGFIYEWTGAYWSMVDVEYSSKIYIRRHLQGGSKPA